MLDIRRARRGGVVARARVHRGRGRGPRRQGVGRRALWGVDADEARRRAPVRGGASLPQFLESVAATLPIREPGRGTSPTTSNWRPTRSGASPTTRSVPSPSTSTAPTPTSPKRSSAGSPSSAGSACRCPRSTAGSRPAASPTTWHGRGDRGALAGLAGHRRVAHHPSRDPHPRPRRRRHRGAEAALVAPYRVRRADGRHSGDRARLRLRRRRRHHHRNPVDGGYRINGVKTWARSPGGRSAHAARAHRSDAARPPRPVDVHRPEGRGAGPRLRVRAGGGGKIEGRAIDTIGYRGMHSYEVAFDDWFVPAENLIGERRGLGRGFYLQMEGFENGRLQTAARAVGLMQAAFEAGLAYAASASRVRQARVRLPAHPGEARPHGGVIQAGRQFSYDVARRWAAAKGRSRRPWSRRTCAEPPNG